MQPLALRSKKDSACFGLLAGVSLFHLNFTVVRRALLPRLF